MLSPTCSQLTDAQSQELRGAVAQFEPHRWQVGDSSTLDLAEHLRSVSAASANAALDNYRAGSVGSVIVSATAAGVALEAAIKYSLAATNPLLVGRNPENAAVLARSAVESIDITTLRTLEGAEAARSLRTLRPRSKRLPTVRTVQTVLVVRNAAAHIGHVSNEDLDRSLQAMVSGIDAILDDLDDDGEFWNEVNVDLAESLGDEAIVFSDLELQLRLSAGRRRFDGLDASTVELLEERAVSLQSPPETIEWTCPACERKGLLDRYVSKSDLDFTGARYPDEHPRGYRYAYPESFRCLVCGLALNGDAELDFCLSRLDEIWEEELEPSEGFERALEDWRYESRRELEREHRLDRMWPDPEH